MYPVDGFDTVADEDFIALGKQILDCACSVPPRSASGTVLICSRVSRAADQVNLNRTVFLRYAPEMQGLWMKYGMQPQAFNQSWHNMYALVKSVAPETIMVWAPNTPQGYPYGQQGAQYNALSAVDKALLDTNNNGQLDAGDDALSPYYPGDDVVDWIGLSICASRGPPFWLVLLAARLTLRVSAKQTTRVSRPTRKTRSSRPATAAASSLAPTPRAATRLRRGTVLTASRSPTRLAWCARVSPSSRTRRR